MQLYPATEGLLEFICECSDAECTERIVLTADEYTAVRAHPTRFAIASGHEAPRFERVVAAKAAFSVVEKPLSL